MVADKCVSGAGSSTTTRRVLSERTPSSQVPTKFLQLVRLCTYSKTSGQESYNEALAVMLGRFLVFLFGFSEGRKVPSASQPASQRQQSHREPMDDLQQTHVDNQYTKGR